MNRYLNWFAGLAALAFAGGASAAPAPAAQVEGTPLGQNFAGETCRINGAPTATRALDIFCGTSTTSAGRLQLSGLPGLSADANARRAAILARARAIVSGLS